MENLLSYMTDMADADLFAMALSCMAVSTVLAASGLYLARRLENAGPAAQAFLLRAVLVAVLLSPAVSAVMFDMGFRAFTVPVPVSEVRMSRTRLSAPALSDKTDERVTQSADTAGGSSAEMASQGETRMPAAGSNEPVHLTPASTPSGNHGAILWAGLFIAAWAVFSAFFLLRLGLSWVRIILIRLRADRADGNLCGRTEAIAAALGIQSPTVLVSDGIDSPLVTGLFRPAMIVPFPGDVSDAIIAHELGHIRRHDCFWNLAASVGIALIPFQPLMRVLFRRLEEANDYACDSFAVSIGASPRDYARDLYLYAERCRTAIGMRRLCAGVFSTKSFLLRRIERLCAGTVSGVRSVGGRNAALILALVALVTVVSASVGFSTADDGVSAVEQAVELGTVSASDGAADTVPDTGGPAARETSPAEPPSPPPLAVVLDIPRLDMTPDDPPAVIVAAEPATDVPLSEPVDGGMDDAIEKTAVIDTAPNALGNVAAEGEPADVDERAVENDGADDQDMTAYTTIGACKDAARGFLARGAYRKAETVLQHGMAFDAEDAEIRMLLGKAYRGLRQYDLAMLYFKLATSLDPDYAEAHFQVGDLYLLLGDAAKAWDNFSIAIRLNPAYSRQIRDVRAAAHN